MEIFFFFSQIRLIFYKKCDESKFSGFALIQAFLWKFKLSPVLVSKKRNDKESDLLNAKSTNIIGVSLSTVCKSNNKKAEKRAFTEKGEWRTEQEKGFLTALGTATRNT